MNELMTTNNVNKLFIWIIIIIFVIMFGYVVVSENRYATLEEQYKELLSDKQTIIDSLRRDNETKAEEILLITESVNSLEYKIDSLTKVKRKVIRDTFVVSSSFSESISLLKSNLECVNF